MLLQFPLPCSAASPTLFLSHRYRPLPRRLRPLQSLRDPWRKLVDIDAGEVQERLASWLLKAQTAIADAAAPLVKPIQEVRKPILDRRLDTMAAQEELFMIPETTVNRRTAGGYLSLAAVVSIEQFGRMNGLTGRQMQKIFAAIGTESTRGDARSLVEYCFFRYLSRDSSDFHPNLKELAFQRLIFVTMLAWENPYGKDEDSHGLSENTLQTRLVGEEAFVRIAPAVAGLADISTAHHLFKVLVGDELGISLSLWLSYISELIKVHQGRMSCQTGDVLLSNEQVLCIGSSRKHPVLKWENNRAWPGNLTLTDSALHFEAIGLTDNRSSMRLDLTRGGSRVEKSKVGPFGSKLFDSAVSVSSGSKSDTWVLEFVDFGGEMRRDVWYAFINEVISLYEFIREYGPDDDDPTIHHVYGAHRGKQRAIRTAANDGSVYLHKWMRSPSWASSSSVAFWKNASAKEGIVLSKSLVVADLNLVEKAAKICKEKSKIVETTQATIDAAMIKGIPSNIDLFKELIHPCVVIAKNFDRLKRWEKPHLTISFLAFVYTVIFRNLLSYIFPVMLMVTATAMLLLRGLKEQGRLGRYFGKVTIRDQPPSNTIQKIIALKEAMADTESFLQNVNISLLKVRTIILSGQPEVTTEVALLLLGSAVTLLVVPFKYILVFFILDLFTRDLEFRREMVTKFMSYIRERWASVHAAPVVVLPYESDETKSITNGSKESNQTKPEQIHSGTDVK